MRPEWGDARCTQHYCWCTQHFKWMDENVLHLKFKSCKPISLFIVSVQLILPAPLPFLGCAFELLLFLSVCIGCFLRGLFVAHWVIRCRHWGPTALFCCSTVEVSFCSPLCRQRIKLLVLYVLWVTSPGGHSWNRLDLQVGLCHRFLFWQRGWWMIVLGPLVIKAPVVAATTLAPSPPIATKVTMPPTQA